MNKKDGGPVYPQMIKTWSQNQERFINDDYSEGMTLRDYFAIHADISELKFNNLESIENYIGREINSKDYKDIMKGTCEGLAKYRYLTADAMLQEREK